MQTSGSKKEIVYKIDLTNVSDARKRLTSLQKIFDTSAITGMDSHLFKIRNKNLLYITTNEKGLYELGVRDGYLCFYGSKNQIKKASVTGLFVGDVLARFGWLLRHSKHCVVRSSYRDGSYRNTFVYDLKYANQSIVRTSLYAEYLKN